MTTTRINHTGHLHPNTTAARTACRKALAADLPIVSSTGYVGKGMQVHNLVIAVDGSVVGTVCGAGLGRGVKKNSPIHVTKDNAPASCHSCRK